MDNTLTLDDDNAKKIRTLLVKHEGYKQYIYPDDQGNPTIGVGFNLKEGLSLKECLAILDIRLPAYEQELIQIIPCYVTLIPARKIVLLDMMYQLGGPHIATFRKMITAIQEQDYHQASQEMLNSDWGRNFINRATELAMIMETGKL